MEFKATIKGTEELAKFAKHLVPTVERNIRQAAKEIVTRWKREAQARAPVEFGLMRNRVLTEVDRDEEGMIYGGVGSNADYATATEFGTKWIARGRVLALGDNPEITDQQAVRNWPAKNKTRISEKTGREYAKARRARLKQEELGSPDEQMPWIRPAWMSIKAWAIQRLIQAFRIK